MDYRKFGNTYMVRLDPGEEILDRLVWLASKEDIRTATVRGLGEVNIITLGSYSPESRQYKCTTYHTDFEIVSMEGNLTRKDGKPYPHIHIAVSDSCARCYGGHLNHGEVNGTVELTIQLLEGEAIRETDPELGLNTLQFI